MKTLEEIRNEKGGERLTELNAKRVGKTIDEIFGKETADRMRASWKITRAGKKNPKWKEKIKTTCAHCGKEMRLYPSFKTERNFCSRECFDKHPRARFNNKQSYHNNARRIAFENLPMECRLCGGKENLTVHHIDKDWKNNEVKNLAILCKRCHFGIVHHKRPRRTQNA